MKLIRTLAVLLLAITAIASIGTLTAKSSLAPATAPTPMCPQAHCPSGN
jgi:hypothetical protein